MGLSQDLITQFAKLANNEPQKKSEETVRGTFKVVNGEEFVQIDGSDIWTPVNSTVEAETGERVTVLIKDHTATVTGNITSPTARTKTVENLKDEVDEQGNTIKQIDNSITQQGNSIIQINNSIKQQNDTINSFGNTIDSQNNKIQQFDNTIKQQGDTITSMNNTITSQGNQITSINNTVDSQGNTIKQQGDTIISQGNTISAQENLITQQGNTISQQGNTISQQGDTIASQGNTISAQGNKITAAESNITILNSGFKIVNGSLTGLSEIVVNDLVANKTLTDTLDAKYAEIDFANIEMAAVGKIFSDAGIIKDMVVGEQRITGELVGVTIKGDLIEGNTLKADKLVVLGEDGLYYKLNVNSLGEATASSDPKYQNGLDGSAIIAKSIVATKIAVDDLVAFGATIGGFHIGDHSLYSGVKNSINNTTAGIYFGDDGQMYIGDSNNRIRFYKAASDGSWKLDITADEIKFGTNKKTIEEAINEIELTPGPQGPPGDPGTSVTVSSTSVTYQKSSSGTTKPTGTWSTSVPSLAEGQYLWTKTVVSFSDGKSVTSYSVSYKGTNGTNGASVGSIINYYLASPSGSGITTSTTGWSTDASTQLIDSTNKYLWNYEVVKDTNGNTLSTTDPTIIGKYGENGNDGRGITSIVEYYALSTNTTAPADSNFSTTVKTVTKTNKYLWNYEVINYTSGSPTTTSKKIIGVYGDTGAKGDKGEQGIQGIQGIQGEKGEQGIPGTNGTNGKTTYFHIKYSSVANPTTSSQISETPSTYIGTYVDFTEADSTDPSKYTWSRFEGVQGEKGDQGIPGTNGSNGSTSYLHIAYANSDDGTTGFDVSDSTDKLYIGQYTDFTQADSTDPSKYSWSKIKGEDANAVVHTYSGGGNSYMYMTIATLTVTGSYINTPISFKVTSRGYETSNVQIMFQSGNTKDPTLTWFRKDGTVPLWIQKTATSTWRIIAKKNETYGGGSISDYLNRVSVSITWTAEHIASVPSSTDTNPVYKAELLSTLANTVTSTDVEYYLSSSSTELSGGSWSTTAPAWVNGKYMWSRTKTIFQSGTTEYRPSENGVCIAGATGATGSKGDTGATGKGVKSIEEQYYLSTSNTSRAGGSWSSAQPAWTSGKYMWTRSHITWSDDTTTDTTPILASAINSANTAANDANTKVDNLQIGGSNLIALCNSTLGYVNTSGTLIEKESVNKDTTSDYIAVTPGEEYVLQYWVTPNNSYCWCIYNFYDSSKTWKSQSKEMKSGTTSDPQYKIAYITIPNDVYYINVSARMFNDGRIQLEKGNKPTDWSPAPEDIGVDNLQLGGRNLLFNTRNFLEWTGTEPTSSVNADNFTEISFTASGLTANSIKSRFSCNKINIDDVKGKTVVFSVDIKVASYSAWDARYPFIWEGYDSTDTRVAWTDIPISNNKVTYDKTSLESGEWTRVCFTTVVNSLSFASYVSGKTFNDIAKLGGIRLTLFKNGTISFRKPKLEIGNKPTDWSPAPEDADSRIDSIQSQISEVVVGTQTAATGSWTGVASFSSLVDKQQVTYWLPYDGSGNASLNLTLSDGSTTGAIPCYYGGTSRLTTHYKAGNAVHLTYRENITIGTTTIAKGWWADANYNTNDNTYDRIRYNNNIKAKTAITASTLIVGDSSGYFKLVAGSVFDIDKPILWAGSAITAAATGTNNYLSMPSCTMRNNTSSSWTATQYQTLYLVGSLSGQKFTADSTTFLTTTVPTTDDGKYYISLGYMYSTYQIYLYPEHPIFKYVNGSFKSLNQVSYEAQNDYNNLQVGGRNLARKGCIKKYGTGSATTVNDTNFVTNGGFTFSRTAVQNEGPMIDNGMNFIKGTNYVTSFKIKFDVDTINYIYIYNGHNHINTKVYVDGVYKNTFNQNVPFPTDLKEHTITLYYTSNIEGSLATTDTSTNHTILQPYKSTALAYTATVTGFKTEIGNQPTDWTPAPEDVEAKVDNLKIGGRNYAIGTSVSKTQTGNNGSNQTTYPYKFDITKFVGKKTYTCSFDWIVESDGTNDIKGTFRSQLGASPWSNMSPTITTSSTNNKGHCVYTADVPSNWTSSLSSSMPVGIRSDNRYGLLTISNFKIEEGDKATDWTPAPEDVEANISEVETATNGRIDELSGTVSEAQSSIDTLKGMISTLVTDANGGSLMTQTSDGWTFNIGSINTNLSSINEYITSNDSWKGNNDSVINKLTTLINDVSKDTAYITMGKDDSGAPCIELGRTDTTLFGNKNMLKYTGSSKFADEWTMEKATKTKDGVAMKVTTTGASGTRCGYTTGWWTAPADGKKYYISFYAKCATAGSKIHFNYSNSNSNGKSNTFTLTTSYVRYTSPINKTSGTTLSLISDSDSGQVIYIKNMKLEEGTTATDWLPAPEDSNSDFKVRITNESIDFMEDTTRIAYASNKTFYVEKMIAKTELQIGEGPGFVWKVRSNGNLGLSYISS